MNKKVKSGEINKKVKMRASLILQEFNNLIDKLKFDPIVETFRQNETLKDFYIKRIIELINDLLNNEKETYIEALLAENKKLKSDLNFLKTQIAQQQEKIKDLNGFLNNKENRLEEINKGKEKLDLDYAEMNQRFEFLNLEYKKFKMTHENILKENESSRVTVKQLEEDNFNKEQEISMLKNKNDYFIEEIKTKDEHLDFFKESINQMKEKQEEITQTVENIVQENVKLKLELNNKQELNEEFKNKIEAEYQGKANEYRVLKENYEKLNEQVETVYKIKIKALKSKLKEKVEVLSRREEEIRNFLNR